ncbi:MAG: NAD(P)/FAD-dependent oxidoreductase [Planctomycetaceae bacterium]
MNNLARVVVVGGGFAGLNAVKGFKKSSDVHVTLIDRRNHHLFQPLLYQVAMAGLSPADIAAPLRGILSKQKNVRVLQGEVQAVDFDGRKVKADFGDVPFDYLILACGAKHSYFGNSDWEQHAPGLKTVEQATEIRRRVLTAFEEAERSTSPVEQRRLLTFVVVGGGPTGVELAGAIGEMSRYTLAKDFRSIDPSLARVILIEGGPRILPMFSPKLSNRATRDLESLGVHVWTSSLVKHVDEDGVDVGDENICAATVLWAAGVQASSLGNKLGFETDRAGRVLVEPDLSVQGHSDVFVAGDQAHCEADGKPLPGVAPVAMQQGRFLAQNILADIAGQERKPFRYTDKGKMATIGRSRAITEVGRFRLGGFVAWLVWLVVHVYYLTGFRRRFFVVLSWAWSYLTFRRGARLIVGKEWQSSEPAKKEARDTLTAGQG